MVAQRPASHRGGDLDKRLGSREGPGWETRCQGEAEGACRPRRGGGLWRIGPPFLPRTVTASSRRFFKIKEYALPL